jgi:hypothetical protein
MSHLTIALLVVGAPVLILGAVKAIKTSFENRCDESAPFRNYFGPEYDRDLLRQSSWSDDENHHGLRTRLAVNIREGGVTERYSSGGGTTWRKRDQD